MNRVAIALAALSLTGCAVTMPDKYQANKQAPVYDGTIKGNYSSLARCVADAMQNHGQRGINSAKYDVRVYPDIERAEVQSSVQGIFVGTMYGFLLVLDKIDEGNTRATLRGVMDDAKVAKATLLECSK